MNPPLKPNSKVYEALERFLIVVENEDFVEGHEVLEPSWHAFKKLPESLNDALILKGLINGATALALAKKGKTEGAKRVWTTFEKYAPLIELSTSELTPYYRQACRLLQHKKRFDM